MNLRLLIPALFLAPICLGALWQLPKIWRMKADIQRPAATTTWWPFSEALRESFLRGLPVGILGCTALTASIALTAVSEATHGSTSRVAAAVAWNAFLVFVALMLVDLSVTLFNRPKFVVPPATRDEPGAIALWWRSRKHRSPRRSRSD
ncbi:hypothetical protein [Micromonospora chersina]|uniref:hypothetical protein n=1 Tax=Micromonospora chersina TaxID=47854 RepID=UPI00370FAF8C